MSKARREVSVHVRRRRRFEGGVGCLGHWGAIELGFLNLSDD